MPKGTKGWVKYVLCSNGQRHPPRWWKQFTDQRKHFLRRDAIGIQMAVFPKDAIVVVRQALPPRNARRKHRPDRVGAVRMADS